MPPKLLNVFDAKLRWTFCELEGRGSERTWLVGILKHKIIDHFRKIARRHEVPAAGGQADEEFYPFRRTGEWVGHWREDQAPSDWNLDASTILERKEFWEALDRCLAELPQRTAMAFTLREIDGLSSEEVCDVLNLSQNNLWVMLYRARMQLRNSLEAEWFRNEPAVLRDSYTFLRNEVAR